MTRLINTLYRVALYGLAACALFMLAAGLVTTRLDLLAGGTLCALLVWVNEIFERKD